MRLRRAPDAGLFADGGLTALGINITDMAIVTTVVSYAVFCALVRVLPRTRRSVTVASFLAALVSVPAAAVAFTLIYAVGGTSRRELADILRSLDVTVLMVTHDLPYALELCPRSRILSDGVIAADGKTAELLADNELMRAHRLELPFGFDPRSVTT